MALLTLDRDAPGRTLEWRRVSPAFAPRCAPRSRVWLFVGGFALPPGVIGSPLVVHIYVIGFAPPNVVLARDFFRVGLPAGDWSACDSECTPCDSMGPNLLGQGRVLSANKTARATFSRSSRDRLRELHAQRLRLIRGGAITRRMPRTLGWRPAVDRRHLAAQIRQEPSRTRAASPGTFPSPMSCA